MSKPNVTAERAKQVLSYDSESGIFTWLIHTRNTCIGQIAGTLKKRGYIVISIDGKLIAAHRLAWFFAFGIWPTYNIDHINGCKSDNKICNLRDVPQGYNLQNKRKATSGNKSGFLGVSPNRNRWAASIFTFGVKIHIGTFDTKEEAHAAYLAKKRKLHIGCTI